MAGMIAKKLRRLPVCVMFPKPAAGSAARGLRRFFVTHPLSRRGRFTLLAHPRLKVFGQYERSPTYFTDGHLAALQQGEHLRAANANCFRRVINR